MEGLARDLFGLGLESKDLDWTQAAMRAALLYLAVLVVIRLGKKRFLARGTAFDVIAGIAIGSIIGRSITGGANLSTAVAGVAALVGMHWVFSWIAVRWPGFGTLVKGEARTLVRDGEVDERSLRAAHLTRRDLDEELRGQGRASAEGVRQALLERDGSVSVLADKKPRVVEVRVEPGVQTVRIELG